MWTHGWLEELGHGGRSATDLAETTANMTFHQVSRRTHQLMSWSLLYESAARGQRKRYQLSDQSWHAMALVAGLGRRRQQHVTGQADGGLTAPGDDGGAAGRDAAAAAPRAPGAEPHTGWSAQPASTGSAARRP